MTPAEKLRMLIETLEDRNGDPRQIQQLQKELNDLEYEEVEEIEE